MFDSIINYGIAFVQILFPIYYLYKLWTKNYKIQSLWLVDEFITIGFLLVIFFIGRWDVAGYYFRYWLYGIYLLVSVISITRVLDLSFYDKEAWTWKGIPELLIIAGMLIWTFLGFYTEKESMKIEFPLKGESYYIAHGGSTPILNYHGAFLKSQNYAIDITQLNKWGFRASGIYPKNLYDYNIYSDTVYSPIKGKVIQAIDSLSEQKPPKKLVDKPKGNYIWIRNGKIYLAMAHLKHNSVSVKPGERVFAGQPIAQVGNTGNTSEPHLHIHAVKTNQKVKSKNDSLLNNATAIPLIFKEGKPIRNQLFRTKE